MVICNEDNLIFTFSYSHVVVQEDDCVLCRYLIRRKVGSDDHVMVCKRPH